LDNELDRKIDDTAMQFPFLYKKLVFWYATIFIESRRDFSLNTALKNLRNARIFFTKFTNSNFKSVSSLSAFYIGMYHLLSDELESMEI